MTWGVPQHDTDSPGTRIDRAHAAAGGVPDDPGGPVARWLVEVLQQVHQMVDRDPDSSRRECRATATPNLDLTDRAGMTPQLRVTHGGLTFTAD